MIHVAIFSIVLLLIAKMTASAVPTVPSPTIITMRIIIMIVRIIIIVIYNNDNNNNNNHY